MADRHGGRSHRSGLEIRSGAVRPFCGRDHRHVRGCAVSGPVIKGTRFGKYTLINRIAVGGMAEIFLARQEGLEGFEKTICIKRIRPHLSSQVSFVRMFLNEAKLAAQLNHPNLSLIHI